MSPNASSNSSMESQTADHSPSEEKTGCLSLTFGLIAVGAISIATTIIAYFIVKYL